MALSIEVLDGDYWTETFNYFNLNSQLRDSKEDLEIHMHSYGGSYFEGLAMYNRLISHKGTVTFKLSGINLSMGSLLSTCGDVVEMPSNGFYFMHNVQGGAFGDADELNSTADVLAAANKQVASMYAKKSKGKLTVAKAQELMDADSYLTAKQAKKYGLVDKVTTGIELSNKKDLSGYKNLPKELKNISNNKINKMSNNFIDKVKEFFNRVSPNALPDNADEAQIVNALESFDPKGLSNSELTNKLKANNEAIATQLTNQVKTAMEPIQNKMTELEKENEALKTASDALLTQVESRITELSNEFNEKILGQSRNDLGNDGSFVDPENSIHNGAFKAFEFKVPEN